MFSAIACSRSGRRAAGTTWPRRSPACQGSADRVRDEKPEEALMKNGDKIISMIPAAGYYAEYKDGDEPTFNPVAAWVVIEDRQGRQRVDGVDPSGDGGDGSPCGNRDAFVGFVYREERERRR
jgi:hypothetical protein